MILERTHVDDMSIEELEMAVRVYETMSDSLSNECKDDLAKMKNKLTTKREACDRTWSC